MIKSLLLSAALVASASTAAQAVPLFADDFESYTKGAPGSISPTWTVSFGSVDVIGTPGDYAWYPTQQIDLNGSSASPDDTTAAYISHIVSGFLVGTMYTLTFDYGNNKNSNDPEELAAGLFDLDSNIVLMKQIFIKGAMKDMISVSYNFTATKTVLELFFEDSSHYTAGADDNQGGPIIDNVSIDVAPVPLPAAAPLLLAALGGLAFMRRRRA